MTKIVKAPASAASSVFHVQVPGATVALCGATPHGMFLLEPSEKIRATCAECLSAIAPCCPHCGGKL